MGRPRKNRTTTFDQDTGEVYSSPSEEEGQDMLPAEPMRQIPEGVYMADDDEMPPPLRHAQTPVSNDEYLPLFPDADKFPEHHVAHIKVTKLAPVGEDGYKGELPPTAAEEVIWRNWGDGTYRIQACNAQGRELRKRDNCVISKGPRPAEVLAAAPPSSNGSPDLAIINRVLDTVKEQIASIKSDKEIAVSQVRRQQEQQGEFMAKQSDKTTMLLSEHYKSGASSQQAFFGAMMQMQQQAHQMMMQNLIAMQQLQSQQNDPRVLMATLMQGIQLARDLGDGGGEEELPTSVLMMREGAKAIGDIKDMAMGSMFKPKKLAPPQPIQASIVTPAPISIPGVPPAPELAQAQTSQNGNGHAKPAKERTFTPTEAMKIKQLKLVADGKGLDFEDLLDQALGYVGAAPEADAPEEEVSDTAQAEAPNGDEVHHEQSEDSEGAA